uniref:Uncharacterized protein n=1 Tax=Anguilla anguilla TaxID=7936 RepID=A0A0E9QEJ3_ANGAN
MQAKLETALTKKLHFCLVLL